MRRLWTAIAVVAGLGLAVPASDYVRQAWAAARNAIVVASCGTLSHAQTVGSDGAQTVDANGNTCITGSVLTNPYPSGAVQVNATSGIVAANTAIATLAGAAGKNTYITGFQVSALGATAAANVDCTVSGLTGPTVFHYNFSFPAGATVPATPLIVKFDNPVISFGVATNIVVSCPSGGAGNTYTAVNAQGFVF